MNYYERIRYLREDADLSQAKVAAMLNVAQTTYSDYENGKVRIPIEIYVALAKHYNVNLDYLAGISNEKKSYPKR